MFKKLAHLPFRKPAMAVVIRCPARSQDRTEGLDDRLKASPSAPGELPVAR